jgi:hypothetical protein
VNRPMNRSLDAMGSASSALSLAPIIASASADLSPAGKNYASLPSASGVTAWSLTTMGTCTIMASSSAPRGPRSPQGTRTRHLAARRVAVFCISLGKIEHKPLGIAVSERVNDRQDIVFAKAPLTATRACSVSPRVRISLRR